jgi:hypothetical protein
MHADASAQDSVSFLPRPVVTATHITFRLSAFMLLQLLTLFSTREGGGRTAGRCQEHPQCINSIYIMLAHHCLVQKWCLVVHKCAANCQYGSVRHNISVPWLLSHVKSL